VHEVLSEQGWRPRRTTTAAVEYTDDIKLPTSFALPTKDGQNLVYLEKRGVNGDLAKYFHLRMCLYGWWNFTKDDDSSSGQSFDDRLIIPVFDLNGELKTFQGRDITGESDKKYLFPKGLPGTGRYLFNGQNAMRCKRVCLGEGAFDVIAIKKAFDEEVTLRDVMPVGSFGKHLSYGSLEGDDQLGRFIQLKSLGLEEVTIMWDGEVKALIAALDAAKILRGVGLRARIATLPFDRDPNEVLPEVVREVFWNAHIYTASLDLKWRLKNPYFKSR
jgi:DNA primase